MQQEFPQFPCTVCTEKYLSFSAIAFAFSPFPLFNYRFLPLKYVSCDVDDTSYYITRFTHATNLLLFRKKFIRKIPPAVF
jgi:hypothetical protein